MREEDIEPEGNSEETDCQYGPVMMAAKQEDIARLLRAMYENITVNVEWSEDVETMNISAVKNLLRGSRLLLMDALGVYGFKDYNDALSSMGEKMTR